MIIAYIITFIIVGIIIGFAFEESIATITIIVISVLWAFVMGPWAIATLIELSIGYALAKKIKG